MATQTLSPTTPDIKSEKTSFGNQTKSDCQPQKKTKSPMYISPYEFRMKILKRILSVDGTLDNKTLQNLQRSSNDRAFQANLLFQNGDIGTLISFNRPSEKDSNEGNLENEKSDAEHLPPIQAEQETQAVNKTKEERRERPLKLVPIILPPIYTLTPRVLMIRDFSSPTSPPPPLCEEDWKDLEDCRYLRPVKKQFNKGKESKSFLL